MQRDELLRLWRGQGAGEEPRPEEIVMQVKKRAEKFDRILWWRDALEVMVGVFLAASMIAATLPVPSWWPKVGAAIAVVLIAGVLSHLLGARKGMPSAKADLPLAERIRAEIVKVEAQIRLLSSVRSWYIVPLAVAGTVWVVSFVPAVGLPVLPALGVAALLVLVCDLIFWVVGYGVERLNVKAVEQKLQPYRAELAALLDELEGKGSADT